MEWDLSDKKKFGHKAGSVRIGAGHTYALSLGLGREETYSLGHAPFTFMYCLVHWPKEAF
jgi:hypothetical protein